MAATPLTTTARTPAGRISPRTADRLLHWGLAAVSLGAVVAILAVAGFVVHAAWPAFRANGLGIFGDSSTPLDRQLDHAFQSSPAHPARSLHAWPAVLGTILTTGGALALALPFALLSAVFLALLAPRRVRAIVEPTVGLLAATPSVVFGLFAILAVAPLIDRHLIDQKVADEYAPIVTISGSNVLKPVIRPPGAARLFT